jgi:hypothetical protein
MLDSPKIQDLILSVFKVLSVFPITFLASDLSKILSTFKNDNIFPRFPHTVYTICIYVSLIF